MLDIAEVIPVLVKDGLQEVQGNGQYLSPYSCVNTLDEKKKQIYKS